LILILQVDDFEESSKKLALTVHSLDPSGLYVFDDGFSFIIWLGRMFPSDIVNKVLGIDLSIFADLSKVWFTLKMSAPNKVGKHTRLQFIFSNVVEVDCIDSEPLMSYQQFNQFVSKK